MLRHIRYFMFVAFLTPLFAIAATAIPSSVGIPSGGIWFSKEPFYVGDQITVNTLVFNASLSVVRGSLELLDGTTIIQQKDIALDPGDNKIVAFPVQVTRGKHAFHIRVAGSDFTSNSGATIPVKTTGDYVAQTVELKREAAVDPVKTTPVQPSTNGTTSKTGAVSVSTNGTQPITSEDAQNVANSVEKVIPAKVVEPVVGLAVPVIGATESFRVGQAERTDEHINTALNDIVEKVGSAKVLGSSVAAPESKGASVAPYSAWSVFREGVTSSNFVKTPFGYIKLFIFLLYQWIVTSALIFYVVSFAILIKIFLVAKRFIFPPAV